MRLRCPDCKTEKEVPDIAGDCLPEGTALIETSCPECADDFTSETYFDKDGNELFLD